MKFNENRLKGSGYMERTRTSRINSLSLTCDLELTKATIKTWIPLPIFGVNRP